MKLAHALLVLLCSVGVAQADEVLSLARADGAQTPVKVYRPKDGNACAPVAILSHGAGGSENGLKYLAEALQADGWLTLVPGHKESGTKVLKSEWKEKGLKEGLLDMTSDPDAYQARFDDIGAALKWAQSSAGQNCTPPFKALLGHSMGAATTLLEAGARNKLDLKGADRFDAYVPLSPQGVGVIFPEHAWNDIRTPVLNLTGTRDKALEGDWQTRTEPWKDMPPGCKWLGVIDGATHMNLGGGRFSGKTEKITTQLAIAFLDAQREGHCATPPVLSGVSLQTK